jgi:hypothetical protein
MALSQQRGLTRETDFNTALAALPSDFELTWGIGLSTAEIREKISWLIDPIEGASEIITEAVDSLSVIIDLLASIIDVVSAVIGVGVDILEGFVLLIREVIQQIRELFTGTSISAMFYFPTSVKERRKPNELLYDIGMSYLDKNDSKRPISTRNNYAAALVAMFSLPNIDALLAIADRVRKAFSSVLDTNTYTSQASSATYKDAEYIKSGTSGMAPDWDYNYALSDFAWAQALIAKLNEALSALGGVRPIAEKFNSVLNIARARLEALRKAAQTLLQAIQSLQTMLALGDSQAVFLVMGKGDNEDFAKAIINAPNHPQYPKADLGEPNYSAGGPVVIVNPEMGRSLLYSGAIAFHVQVGAGDNIDRLKLITDLIFKPVVGYNPLSGYDPNPQETELSRAIDGYNAQNNKLQQFQEGIEYTNVWRARRDVPKT